MQGFFLGRGDSRPKRDLLEETVYLTCYSDPSIDPSRAITQARDHDTAVPLAKLYHMGLRQEIKRSTLADANEARDWRIHAEFAQRLIVQARKLYLGDSFGIELENTTYALDSTTIDLCLSLFPWALFRTTKSAVKMHTLLDLRGNIPSFIHISDGKLGDVNVLDILVLEPGAIYLIDRGYLVFGMRLTHRLRGKLATTLEQIPHGHHIFRAYCKHAFVKQYEKFSTFLRNEICSNNLADFGLRKGLEHLAEMREKFLDITERFATFQARCLNAQVDFPLLQRLALPITLGSAKYPGIKIHDTRMIRLMQVLLHARTTVGGWRAQQLHDALLMSFGLSAKRYGLNQLRYDLRKLRAHALLERDGTHYAYRLTDKGLKVALVFVLFHQRLCGPLANSLFHHRPNPELQPDSRLEAALHKADNSIRNVIQLLEAA